MRGYAAKMILRLLLLSLCVSGVLRASPHPDWTTNHVPFRIAGNLYYVGSQDLAAYLVVTPSGDILINSNLTTSAPQILQNIRTLGFHPADVKVLLISHAHFDHAAGSAAIVRATHARYEVMAGDAAVVESGGRPDFANGGISQYPSAKVDRVLHDGDEVRLGGTVLVAHLTPGHTKGCTTWTMKVVEGGKSYDVVIVGSTSVLDDYKLKGDPKYPNMAEDYARTFRVLHGLASDIFLGSHAQFFGMEAKYGRMRAGEAAAFVDPAGYRRFVDAQEKAYLVRLARGR